LHHALIDSAAEANRWITVTLLTLLSYYYLLLLLLSLLFICSYWHDNDNDDDDNDDDDDDVVTEAELMASVQQRDAADVSFDSLQQPG